MKLLLLVLSPALSLLTGCGTASQALNSATHVLGTGVRTVSGPIRGLQNAADPGTGTSADWKAGIERVRQEDSKLP